MTTIRSRTLGQQVYEFVRGEILAGRFAPATELNEVAIAEELGVSRGPVREAFGRLNAEGLIETRPHRGSVVSELDQKEFLDAYQMREALEVFAVQLAMKHMTDDTIATLESHCDAMRKAADETNEGAFFQHNAAFHSTLVHAAQNVHLTRFHDALTDQMGRYQRVSVRLRGDLVSSIQEHQSIVDAIKNGDTALAMSQVREHVEVPQMAINEITEAEWQEMMG